MDHIGGPTADHNAEFCCRNTVDISSDSFVQIDPKCTSSQSIATRGGKAHRIVNQFENFFRICKD